MIHHWLTRPEAPIETTFVKRFDPLHWTVDFPRGAMASVITGETTESLIVHARFLRTDDLIGLVYETSDRHAHPAHRREAKFDYSNCRLGFNWSSDGIRPLNLVNGPTLTIEGQDATGEVRSWYVRLWNYAVGTGTAARIELDFDNLDGGYALPADAQRVDPRHITRMFISLVPDDFEPGRSVLLPAPIEAQLRIGNLVVEGSGSILAINDARIPEQPYRICSAYDDQYHLVPERIVDSIERLGFRKLITHYVGMSHYFALGSNGLLDDTVTLNAPALAWHRAFAKAAKRRGFTIIWSLSFEILDMFCVADWKQRSWSGASARTGYDPPSTLVSPASDAAIAFLGRVAASLVDLSTQAGMAPKFQIGEPWWWVAADHSICLYDDQAKSRFGPLLTKIDDVRGPKSSSEIALLDEAGRLLADATLRIRNAARVAAPTTEVSVLVYLCGPLAPDAPEVRRANLPMGWASPNFDVVQFEDYEWVTGRQLGLRRKAISAASLRLGYALSAQHYFAGFVADSSQSSAWSAVLEAAQEARARGVAEVFLWALPQVLRDGLTIFGSEGESVEAFEDVDFPIQIGSDASVSPEFSTSVVTSTGGAEFRNVNWSEARLRFDAGPGVRGDAELEALLSFFRARRGSAIGFRFRDPFDFSSNGMSGVPSSVDQKIGTGDGQRSIFVLRKSYGEGEVRTITRPAAQSIKVSVDGTEVADFTLGLRGQILFDLPPAAGAVVRAGFLFDVPVRFAEDRLDVNVANFRAGEAPSVPLIEIRDQG